MAQTDLTLDQTMPGQRVTVCRLNIQGGMRRRLQDIGMIPGTKIVCVGTSPLGDPSAFLIRGAVIAIRKSDSSRIIVSRS